VVLHDLATGRSRTFGELRMDLVAQSFGG